MPATDVRPLVAVVVVVGAVPLPLGPGQLPCPAGWRWRPAPATRPSRSQWIWCQTMQGNGRRRPVTRAQVRVPHRANELTSVGVVGQPGHGPGRQVQCRVRRGHGRGGSRRVVPVLGRRCRGHQPPSGVVSARTRWGRMLITVFSPLHRTVSRVTPRPRTWPCWCSRDRNAPWSRCTSTCSIRHCAGIGVPSAARRWTPRPEVWDPAGRQEPEAVRGCSTGGQPGSWWGTGERHRQVCRARRAAVDTRINHDLARA